MKRFYLFFVSSILSIQTLFAQWSVIVHRNETYVGRNVGLTLKKSWDNHSVILGTKYNLNSRVHDLNPDHHFKKRFYANLWSQHFGAIVGYTFDFPAKMEGLVPFFFYDLQFTRSDILSDRYEPTEIIDGRQYYKYINAFDPVTIALEQVIGIGLRLPLLKQFYLYQRVGMGLASFHGVPLFLKERADQTYDISFLISLGIEMGLQKSK